jgi:ABC-2 type transport system permease protein
MHILTHILRYKILSYIKSTFDRRNVSYVRGIASLLVFGGFAYFAYLFASESTRFVLDHTRTGLYLFHTFISMMLFVFFITVNLGNIIVSYSTLYRSTEVRFLLTKPISFLSIFTLKFLDNFFYSSTTLFLGAFMILLGYGSYFGYPLYYITAIMLFVIVPFMFLSASIAVLILMAIMKLAGRIGFRKVLTGLFIIYLFFIYIFFDSSNPMKLVENLNSFIPDMDAYIAQSTPEFLRYLPNQWVAEFLYYCARGEISHALQYAGILLSAVIIVFCICLYVAEHFYYRSWLISLQVQSTFRAHNSPGRKHFFDFQSRSLFPSQIEALLKKELFTFFRETSQWMHLIVMIILTGLFSVSASHINLRFHVMNMHLITYLVLFAFSGFMVGSLALRFGFPMIGLEGQAYWSLRSSPIKQSKIFIVKFLMVFLPVLLISEYIAISSNIPFLKISERNYFLLWFGIFSAFWISLTSVALNLGFGGYFANYFEQNPIRAASTQGATLTFMVTIIYLIITMAIVLMPISTYFLSAFNFQVSSMTLIALPGALFIFISCLLSAFGLIIGLRSMRKDF